MIRFIPAIFLAALSLAACAPITQANVQAATQATVSQAQQDLQTAINLYGIAKGIAEVGATADPTIAPAIGIAIAALDPVVAQAQTALDNATTDAAAIEQLAAEITQQANALTLSGAPVVTVVPNAPLPAS